MEFIRRRAILCVVPADIHPCMEENCFPLHIVGPSDPGVAVSFLFCNQPTFRYRVFSAANTRMGITFWHMRRTVVEKKYKDKRPVEREVT